MADLAQSLYFHLWQIQDTAPYQKPLYLARGGVIQQAGPEWGMIGMRDGPGINDVGLLLYNYQTQYEFGLCYEEILKYLQGIDKVTVNNYASDGAHRSVKDNAPWKKIYRVDTYPLTHMDTTGAVATRQTRACPCYNCGFLTPMENIEIDHHKPQVGGGDQAILKVFRHLGMTDAAGHGKLSTQNNALIRSGIKRFIHIGDGTPQSPKNNPIGAGFIALQGDQDALRARYTLDGSGIIVLSLAIAITGHQDLQTRCLNSYVNLRPLCGACNGRKSNSIKVIPV